MQLAPLALWVSLMLTLSACSSDSLEPKAPQPRPDDWRAIVRAFDRDRLARWRSAWIAGLDRARAAGHAARIAAQGALLEPDRALEDQPAPPPGDYRCRVIKMGAQTKGMLDYITYPWFTCRVTAEEGGRLHFAKIDGSQRPVGDFFADDQRRVIFLGAMALGDETRPLVYGRDAERDMAGIVERIGPRRWRIAMPYPRWESTIDIFELVPKE